MLASLLLLAAALLAALYHHHRRGGSAVALLTLLVLGSGIPFAVAGGGARMDFLALAAVVGALVLAYDGERRPGGVPAEIFPGDERRSRLVARWLAVGVLLGAAAWVQPVCLLLALPLAVEARSAGRPALVFSLVGAVLPWLAALWRGALGPGWLELPSMTHLLDPGLAGWNLVYLAAGRNGGLLVWYLPALMLAACYRRGSGRGWLLAAVGLAAVALTLVAPHDFWGGGGELGGGNRRFLPLYGALWLVPVRAPRGRWLLATAVAAGLFLWPAWLAPRSAALDTPASRSGSLASWLPYETSQRHLPATAEWRGTAVWSRSLGPGLRDGERGPELVPAEGPAKLLIAAERPLESLLLDFGPRAGSELEVEGGRAGATLFRPDGGVRFEIELEGPARRHSMWWSDKRHSLYIVEIDMPGGPEQPLPVAIMARPLDALPRFLLDPGGRARENDG